MLIFDFFAGTGSATKAFEDAGHTVIKVELDPYFEANERDILKLTADELVNKYGEPDFIWASPPCTAFSIASVSHHWNPDKTPKTKAAELGIELVTHTLKLIKQLNPKYGWLMENPRGMLRKQEFMMRYSRTTVSYCQYGDTRMKPTDIWGYVENWVPLSMCKNGDNCHQRAPRGAKTGTQGLKGARVRSQVPYKLGLSVLETLVKNVK
jgi:site-specific DNA-cytosine methylase